MTSEELKERQGWHLAHKIDHALATIDQFVSKLDGKVFVSFSGVKDSTVLLDLCRVIKPDILAVFSNTGNEHPDIVRFVTSKMKVGENIRIIRPKMTPRQVWAKYGFPLVSKETAYKVHSCRINPNSGRVVNKFLNNDSRYRIALKWRYLIDEDYETSNSCCDKLKKEPFHRFILETGLSPIVGVMACESEQRRGRYLRDGGCNTFIDNGLGGGQKQALIYLAGARYLGLYLSASPSDCRHIPQRG